MRTRLFASAAVVALAAFAMPAHAGAVKPQIVDPAGDANDINDQGLGIADQSVSTPADLSSADILSVTFQTVFATKVVKGKKTQVPTGFTVTMTLAAAPGPAIEYRVSGAAAGCSSVFFEYSTSPAKGGSDIRCPATPPASNVAYPGQTIVKGNSIIWSVPINAFPKNTTFSSLNAQTRFNPAAVTAPQIDYASSNATYTVGK